RASIRKGRPPMHFSRTAAGFAASLFVASFGFAANAASPDTWDGTFSCTVDSTDNEDPATFPPDTKLGIDYSITGQNPDSSENVTGIFAIANSQQTKMLNLEGNRSTFIGGIFSATVSAFEPQDLHGSFLILGLDFVDNEPRYARFTNAVTGAK